MNGSGIKYSGANVSASFTRAANKSKTHPRKRPAPFSIRLTDKERAWLKKQAGSRSLGAYIKAKALSDVPLRQSRTKGSEDLAAMGQALAGLGSSRLASNMNQIAKAANIGALPASPELERELHEACHDIRVMRHALIKALGIKPEGGQ